MPLSPISARKGWNIESSQGSVPAPTPTNQRADLKYAYLHRHRFDRLETNFVRLITRIIVDVVNDSNRLGFGLSGSPPDVL